MFRNSNWGFLIPKITILKRKNGVMDESWPPEDSKLQFKRWKKELEVWLICLFTKSPNSGK